MSYGHQCLLDCQYCSSQTHPDWCRLIYIFTFYAFCVVDITSTHFFLSVFVTLLLSKKSVPVLPKIKCLSPFTYHHVFPTMYHVQDKFWRIYKLQKGCKSIKWYSKRGLYDILSLLCEKQTNVYAMNSPVNYYPDHYVWWTHFTKRATKIIKN